MDTISIWFRLSPRHVVVLNQFRRSNSFRSIRAKNDMAMTAEQVSVSAHTSTVQVFQLCHTDRSKPTLDFNWRDAQGEETTNEPRPLENNPNRRDQAAKCYRNVIYTWIFHPPLLMNWVDDHHPRSQRQHTKKRRLCQLRDLADGFWARNRPANFDKKVDALWLSSKKINENMNLDDQNDALEYMQNLLLEDLANNSAPLG